MVVSDAALYHPLRWRKASWTLLPESSCCIDAPTSLVRSARSKRSEAKICRCSLRAIVWQILPVRRSIVQLLIRVHVASEIQSLPFRRFGSGFLHVCCNALKSRVNMVCSSGGNCKGRHCHWRQRPPGDPNDGPRAS